jgi:hypothetical protein
MIVSVVLSREAIPTQMLFPPKKRSAQSGPSFLRSWHRCHQGLSRSQCVCIMEGFTYHLLSQATQLRRVANREGQAAESRWMQLTPVANLPRARIVDMQEEELASSRHCIRVSASFPMMSTRKRVTFPASPPKQWPSRLRLGNDYWMNRKSGIRNDKSPALHEGLNYMPLRGQEHWQAYSCSCKVTDTHLIEYASRDQKTSYHAWFIQIRCITHKDTHSNPLSHTQRNHR